MANLIKFESFTAELAHAGHKLDTDQVYAMFTNSAPAGANTVLANITDLSTAGGYTVGGFEVTKTSSSQSGGTYSLVLVDKTFTATGSVGPFRYIVLYNKTSATDKLIGYYDYGQAVTLNTDESFKIDFGSSAFTIG